MTNSNPSNKNFITPEKAAIILPTIISTLISVIIISAFVIPKFINSNKVNNEYKEFLRKKNELPTLKAQYEEINKKLENLNKEKDRIINLVSGTTNLETFLTRFGLIGNDNEIKFISIKPTSSVRYIDSQNSGLQEELNINVDPLLVETIKKYVVEVNFQSNYKNLLSFLRNLEFQENVILFSDLSIAALDEDNVIDETKEIGLLDVSFVMTIYGRI